MIPTLTKINTIDTLFFLLFFGCITLRYMDIIIISISFNSIKCTTKTQKLNANSLLLCEIVWNSSHEKSYAEDIF